ncbi:MAG: UDP-N-acetylmuramate--L-alanine ligase [Actinomycetales bacterium]|nr:MAG: UDP-N-acetylmuramate--L-alanine ligase [Actinomycetales bacterium]
MSGIARMLHDRGAPVSGSDSRDSGTLTRLAGLGIRVDVGHDAAHVDGADTLVISSAIRDNNPELAAGRQRGLRVLHRAQALAAFASGSPSRIAVAGTNGKTTTTAMIAVSTAAAGLDPSYVIGGDPVDLAGNAHLGQGDQFVFEADESDGSFVAYRPHIAVVTSVQADHLDFYGDLPAVEAAFRAFVRTIEPGGLLVTCADDPGAAALADWAADQGVRVIRYGRSADADVRLRDLRLAGLSASATVELAGAQTVGAPAAYRLELVVPGEHNLLNAAGALAALLYGLPGGAPADQPDRTAVTTWLAALGGFRGVRRRFEQLGEAAGVRVVDDYSHNPPKVAAVIATGLQAAESGRLVVLYQPLLYSRTRDFTADFGTALAPADIVVVTDVYGAREDPLPGVTGALVADAARAAGAAEVHYVANLDDTADALAQLARPGDLVLTVGPGYMNEVGPQLLQLLAARHAGDGTR